MENAVTRRCNGCENPIKFTADTTGGIVLHKNKYYHKECFMEIAKGKVAKRHLPLWQKAIDSIDDLEAEAIKAFRKQFIKDELNRHLLSCYGLIAVPKSFWTVVAYLENGSYRRKQCKPVSTEILLGAWRWGQRNLDKIAAQNKMNNNGPQNNEDRLMYDLAILIGKIPMYLREKAKAENEKHTISNEIMVEVDMSRVGKKQIASKKQNLNDIANDILVD